MTQLEKTLGSGRAGAARRCQRQPQSRRQRGVGTPSRHARSIRVRGQTRQRSFALAPALALALALAAGGCLRPGPQDLLDAAIRARGGPLHQHSREAEARLHTWIPGHWRWQIAHGLPERFRLSIRVEGDEDLHYLFDGADVRSFLGTAPLPVDAASASALRSVARFTAVAALDLLGDPARVAWDEIPAEDLPADAARGMRVRFRDDGSRYRLLFDAALRLVSVEGPATLPELGHATVLARYSDFQPVGPYVLPFHAHYTAQGRPLLDERVVSFLPGDAGLDADPFHRAPHPAHGPESRRARPVPDPDAASTPEPARGGPA